MSTFGKVLAFFNVFAAIILLIIASLDYNAYREARYAALRHDLVLTGLPVDEHEIATDYPDEPLANKLSKGVLDKVFEGYTAGFEFAGPPVKTVLEELDRVKQQVHSNVDALAGEELKRTKLRTYLVTQAKNVEEREELKKLVATGTIEECLNRLDKYFDAIKNLHNLRTVTQGEGSEKNEATVFKDKTKVQDRTITVPSWSVIRYAAAPVLINLSADEKWRERVAIVLGLDAYNHGVGASTHAMTQIAAHVKEDIIRDQGVFSAAYEDMIRRLIYESENLFHAKKRLAEQQAIVKDRQLEVDQRKTEVQKNRDELAALTNETNVEVAKLEAIQRDLFAIQQRLGLALEATQALEKQLSQKATPPRP